MTDTKPDLKPNERKVLDSLLALGEATAAKVGEHAGLAYPTTTPKLRKLEELGLAERFHNEASQTLWRATTQAATGNDDKAGQAASPSANEAGRSSNSDTTEADAAADDSTAPETLESAPQTPATPAAPLATDRPAEPDEAEPEQAEPEEPGGDAPDNTTSTVAEPAPTGDGAAVPADPPAPQAKRKRPAGALEASVLAILQADPNGQYKINELRKRVDKADEATGYPAASAGAIANALDKLTGKGQVVAVPAKHATFQAAPAAG